jgi:hypothetical protein
MVLYRSGTQRPIEDHWIDSNFFPSREQRFSWPGTRSLRVSGSIGVTILMVSSDAAFIRARWVGIELYQDGLMQPHESLPAWASAKLNAGHP